MLLSATQPVRVQRVEVTQAVASHDHDYVEVCVVLGGSAVHRTTTGHSVLSVGDAVVVPPGAVHAFDAPAGLRVANLYHLSEWLLADVRALWEAPALSALFVAPVVFANRRPPRALQWPLERSSFAAVKRELTDLEVELARPTPLPLMLRATLTKLLLRLARSFKAQSGPEQRVDLPAEVAWTVDAAERAIASGQPLRIEAVAEAVGCSPEHLSRQFRAAIGEPPTRYFQRRRVQAAAALLLRADQSVTDIAHELGFADTAHLTRQFKTHASLTPTDYRKRYTAGV